MQHDAVTMVDGPRRGATTDAAFGFLLATQDEDGSWEDFLLPAGASNVWVTAFVGGVLANQAHPGCADAARRAWRFLEGTTNDSGWSYNPTVPADADSTLWGLRLADALGTSATERASAAARCLDLHLCDDGGLTTYATADPIRRYVGLPATVPFNGWTRAHMCVTASGANLARYRDLLVPFLLRGQSPDGSWPAYWWFDTEFSTAEAVAALAAAAADGGKNAAPLTAAIARAIRWANTRVRSLHVTGSGSPPSFALALALRILARGAARADYRDTLNAGLARLTGWQRQDGAWAPSARLRVPRPDRIVPDTTVQWKPWAGLPPGAVTPAHVLASTFDIYSLDHRAAYTTASVLRALDDVTHLREMIGG